MLSSKLDNLLKEAKIDGELMASLGEGIRGFETAAKNLSPTTDAMIYQEIQRRVISCCSSNGIIE